MRKSTGWRLSVVSGGGRQLQPFIASRQTSKTRSISAGSTKVSKASLACSTLTGSRSTRLRRLDGCEARRGAAYWAQTPWERPQPLPPGGEDTKIGSGALRA